MLRLIKSFTGLYPATMETVLLNYLPLIGTLMSLLGMSTKRTENKIMNWRNFSLKNFTFMLIFL